MKSGIGRREFLLGSAASLVCVPACAQDLVIRPALTPGTDPRYAAYSQVGPMIVTNNAATVHDPAAGLRYLVHFPRTSSSARLIVFSHEALAEPNAYRAILSHWSSHGFVVVAPLHQDSLVLDGLRAKREDAWGGTTWELNALLTNPEGWQRRCQDCVSALNAVDLIAKATSVEIDAERPVVIGHGLGAHVAQALMGAQVSGADGNPLDLADTRFYASALLSPPGHGRMGLTEQSWRQVERPILVVTGDKDVDIAGNGMKDAEDAFRLSTPGYKHMAFLSNGTRSAYLGTRQAADPKEVMTGEDVKAVVTAFVLAYANHDQQAFADVIGDFFDRATARRVSMSYR